MSSSTIEHQSAVRILPIRRSDQIKEATLLTTLAVGLILALGAVLGISMGGVNAYAGFGLLIAAPLLIGDIFLTRSLLHSYGNRQLSQQEVDRLNIDPYEIPCLADDSCSPEWIARNVSTHSPAQLHDDQHRTGTLQVNSLPVFWVTYKQTDKEQTTLYFPDVRDRAQFMRAHLLKSVDLDQLDCLVFPGIPLSDGQIRYGTLPTIGKRQVYFWYAWKTPDKPIQTSIVSPHPTSLPGDYLPHVNYWNLAPLDRELNAFRNREQLDQKLTAKNQCWPATINGTPLLFVHNGKEIVVKEGHNTDGLENVKPSTPPPST